MRTLISILQSGNSQELEILLEQTYLNQIDNYLSFCNLKPISYAALCGNLEVVVYLINKAPSQIIRSSNDCNLLTWASICNDITAKFNLINYIYQEKIFELFDDDTQKFHVEYLLNTDLINIKNDEDRTSDGLSVFYYLLLSVHIPSCIIHDACKNLKLHNIITSDLNNLEEEKIRRLARYHYITGYYSWKHSLSDLSIESYKRAIEYYESLPKLLSHDLKELSYSYYSLGKIYFKSSQWIDASECYKYAVLNHTRIESCDKEIIDHQDLTNYRSNLAGYMHDEVDNNFFCRYINF